MLSTFTVPLFQLYSSSPIGCWGKRPLLGDDNFVEDKLSNKLKYWVGFRVHLDFSITVYGKAQMNFLANPIESCKYDSEILVK